MVDGADCSMMIACPLVLHEQWHTVFTAIHHAGLQQEHGNTANHVFDQAGWLVAVLTDLSAKQGLCQVTAPAGIHLAIGVGYCCL